MGKYISLEDMKKYIKELEDKGETEIDLEEVEAQINISYEKDLYSLLNSVLTWKDKVNQNFDITLSGTDIHILCPNGSSIDEDIECYVEYEVLEKTLQDYNNKMNTSFSVPYYYYSK